MHEGVVCNDKVSASVDNFNKGHQANANTTLSSTINYSEQYVEIWSTDLFI